MGKEAVSAVPLLFITRILPDNGGFRPKYGTAHGRTTHKLSPTALSAHGAVSLSGALRNLSGHSRYKIFIYVILYPIYVRL